MKTKEEKIVKRRVSLPVAIISLVLGCAIAYASVIFTLKLFQGFATTAHDIFLYSIVGICVGIGQYIFVVAGKRYRYSGENKFGYFLTVLGFCLVGLSILATVGFQTVSDSKNIETAKKSSDEYKRLETQYKELEQELVNIEASAKRFEKNNRWTKGAEVRATKKTVRADMGVVSKQMKLTTSTTDTSSKATTDGLAALLGWSNEHLNLAYKTFIAIVMEISAIAFFEISGFFNTGTFLYLSIFGAWLKRKIITDKNADTHQKNADINADTNSTVRTSADINESVSSGDDLISGNADIMKPEINDETRTLIGKQNENHELTDVLLTVNEMKIPHFDPSDVSANADIFGAVNDDADKTNVRNLKKKSPQNRKEKQRAIAEKKYRADYKKVASMVKNKRILPNQRAIIDLVGGRNDRAKRMIFDMVKDNLIEKYTKTKYRLIEKVKA